MHSHQPILKSLALSHPWRSERWTLDLHVASYPFHTQWPLRNCSVQPVGLLESFSSWPLHRLDAKALGITRSVRNRVPSMAQSSPHHLSLWVLAYVSKLPSSSNPPKLHWQQLSMCRHPSVP